MLKRKREIIFILVLVVTLIISSTYLIKITAEKEFAKGNYQLSILKYEEAHNSYIYAATLWPLLKNTQEYQKKIKFIQALSENIQKNPDFTFFLKETISDQELEQFAEEISNKLEVKGIKIITQEEVFKAFQNQNKDNPMVLEVTTKDVFPAIIEVYLYVTPSSENQKNIVEWAKSKPFVSTVIFNHKSYK